MTTAIIITLCVLLLLAYVFDLTSGRTKIPSVILLLILGFGARYLAQLLELTMPDLTPLLPIFGTIGLILIVLEGSLELEFNKSKAPLIRKSFITSLLPMIALAFLLSFLFQYFAGSTFKNGLINAVPFCIVSSAIAIPSVKSLITFDKEFIIYESSLSDILGVLFFNFVSVNNNIGLHSLGNFGLELIVITIVSFVATIGLAFLLNKIDHHIKFVPIILLIILIYSISKIYHLPALVFILLFGLFLGNLDEMKHNKWIKKLKPETLDTEVQKFKELTIEGAFLVRAIFFLLFGYLIQPAEILNTGTLIWAIVIVAAIFLFRAVQLKLSKLPFLPLLFIAPRGLITILLFLAIEPNQNIPIVNKSLIIQVIVLTSLVMMVGLMRNKNASEELVPNTLADDHQSAFPESIKNESNRQA
ncbi:MAG: cation:proton antiporter [Chitinophagaceae bacterium]